MKRFLLLALTAGLALPTAVNAEADYFGKYKPTQEEFRVLTINKFFLCKIQEGGSKELLSSELKNVLKQKKLNYQLANKQELIDIATAMIKDGDLCNSWKEFKTWNQLTKYENQLLEKKKKSYEELKGEDLRYAQTFALMMCLQNKGKISPYDMPYALVKTLKKGGIDLGKYMPDEKTEEGAKWLTTQLVKLDNCGLK